VQLLLENSTALLDIVDDMDRTPLYVAAHVGAKECVEVMLKFGAKVEPGMVQHEGGDEAQHVSSALHAAAASGHVDCLKLLLAAGGPAACTLQDGFDRTPLHVAAAAGHVDCVEVRLHILSRISLSSMSDASDVATLLHVLSATVLQPFIMSSRFVACIRRMSSRSKPATHFHRTGFA
jgi:ankyrin repeat protein